MRKPLTVSRFRNLTERMASVERTLEDRALEERDLLALGYSQDLAKQILKLLSEEEQLDYYLQKAARLGCVPITRVSEAYPMLLRRRLRSEAPGCLWARGDLSFLEQPAVSLVGSRELQEENWKFAAEVGRQAALQGYVLISGNARGADRTAQESCLAAGGKIISIVPDALWKQPLRENVLWLSEDDYDESFSSQRALSRNRCIHALGVKTFVAQTGFETGGTWSGTVKNLRHGWSSVYCFDDGSQGARRLGDLGAELIGIDALQSFYDLPTQENLFTR